MWSLSPFREFCNSHWWGLLGLNYLMWPRNLDTSPDVSFVNVLLPSGVIRLKSISYLQNQVIWVAINLRSCARSEDSDEPAQLHSLVRIFTVRFLDTQCLQDSSCGKWKLWPDFGDAPVDFRFRQTHLLKSAFPIVTYQCSSPVDLLLVEIITTTIVILPVPGTVTCSYIYNCSVISMSKYIKPQWLDHWFPRKFLG